MSWKLGYLVSFPSSFHWFYFFLYENSISSGNDTGAGGLIFVLALTLLVLLLVLKLKGWYYIGDTNCNGISVGTVAF